MNVFEYAAKEEAIFEANYHSERKTTFYSDLSIAEFVSGAKGVRDTYNQVVKSWLTNVEYFTEFVCCLNLKIWEHFKKDDVLSDVYSELYFKANDLAYSTYKGKDLNYYFYMTD